VDVAELTGIDPWDVDQLRLPPGVTAGGRPPFHQPGEAFLPGPIPFVWVATACQLPGTGPHVAFTVRFLRNRFRRGRDRRWGLETIAIGLKVSGKSVRRGLLAAERAGLLCVARSPGRRLIVADVDITRPSGGAVDTDQLPLRGPLPWSWLLPALRLPGAALRVGMACWLQAGWERSGRVELALGEWTGLGLSRFSAARGLDSLARAGLVSVARRAGRPPVVMLREDVVSD
jgi:hypothetical protein